MGMLGLGPSGILAGIGHSIERLADTGIGEKISKGYTKILAKSLINNFEEGAVRMRAMRGIPSITPEIRTGMAGIGTMMKRTGMGGAIGFIGGSAYDMVTDNRRGRFARLGTMAGLAGGFGLGYFSNRKAINSIIHARSNMLASMMEAIKYRGR